MIHGAMSTQAFMSAGAGGNPQEQAMPVDAVQLLASFDEELSFTEEQAKL